MAAGAGATPVTLAFEAEVIDVDVLAPALLPFSVENGDVLKGQFTFEPLDADPGIGMTSTDIVQEYNFSLMLDTTVLSTSKYTLNVRDNSLAIDAPFFTDHIAIHCVGGPSCETNTIPGADSSIAWGFLLPLSGEDSILNGADISADPDVWSQFRGIISIGIFNRGGPGVLTIFASIKEFSAVPEPSSFCLVIFASSWALSRSFCSLSRQSLFAFK